MIEGIPEVLKARWSPSPWSMDPEGRFYVSIEAADGSVVCDVHHGRLTEEEVQEGIWTGEHDEAAADPLCHANCVLIEKAPELAESLLEMLEVYRDICRAFETGEPYTLEELLGDSFAPHAQKAQRLLEHVYQDADV